MAVLGTFGSFGIARLAIYASSSALSVTGNNIANINTNGYCRQVLNLNAMYTGGADQYASGGKLNFGAGVASESISQYRDPYMDIRYRDENTSVGEYETKLSGLNGLSQILDEVAKGDGDFGIIEAQFSEIVEQLQSLSEKSGSEEYDSLVRSACETLVQLFNSYSNQLSNLEENVTEEYMTAVGDTNTIISQIRDLNEEIRNAGIYGDQALTLRDQRNLLIDELSNAIGIDVYYTEEDIGMGVMVENLTIKLEGTDIELIDGIYCTQLNVDEYTAMVNPSISASGEASFDSDARSSYMYVDLDGNYTNNAGLAAPWENPAYPDPDDDTVLPWLKADGTPTANVYEAGPQANSAYKYWIEGTDPAADVPNPTPVLPDDEIYMDGQYAVGQKDTSGNWLLNEDGSYVVAYTTNDMNHVSGNYGVIQLNNNVQDDNDNDNCYLITLSPMKDGKGNYMKDDNNRIITGSVYLDDTVLSGSLQAYREMLTEEGEYSSELDIAMDEGATTKRGIPYYRYALDSLARQFASLFNAANVLGADDVFATTSDGKFYDGDIDKVLTDNGIVELDGNGNPIYQVLTGYDDEGKVIELTTSNMYDMAYDDDGDPMDMTNYEAYIYTSGVRQPNFLTDENGFYLEAVDSTDDDGNPIVLYQPINIAADGETPVYLSSENLTPAHLEDLLKNGVGDQIYNPEDMFETDASGNFLDSLGRVITDGSGNNITKDNILGSLAYFEILQESGVYTSDYSHFNKEGNLFSTSSNTNDAEGITAANISISRDWSIGEVRILLAKGENPGSSENSNVLKIISMMDGDYQYYASDLVADAWEGKDGFFKGSFQEMLTNTVSTLAQDTNTTTTLLMNSEVTALSLNNARISVSGVDLNDEATNMMQYQKSYVAAARLMTTLDEVIEVLLNM